MNTANEKPVGIYSAKAAERYGSSFWSTPDGGEVEITACDKPSNYLWDDKVIVGEVVQWKRKGQVGTQETRRDLGGPK